MAQLYLMRWIIEEENVEHLEVIHADNEIEAHKTARRLVGSRNGKIPQETARIIDIAPTTTKQVDEAIAVLREKRREGQKLADERFNMPALIWHQPVTGDEADGIGDISEAFA